MRGHMGEAVEYFDCVGVVYHLHAFAHILDRNAVVMFVQRDIAVALNCRHRPLPHLVTCRRQRPQGILLNGIEELPARLLSPGKVAAVERLKRPEHGYVERFQVMEHRSLQVNIHRPVHKFHRVLHQGLVLGTAYPGRDNGAAVVFGKGGEVGIDHGFVAVAARDGRLQIVGDYRHWRASVEMYGILARLYHIFLFLCPHRLAVRVLAAWKYRHKDLCLSDFGCKLVNDLQPVAREVDIHLVAGPVFDMAHGACLEHELLELHAE